MKIFLLTTYLFSTWVEEVLQFNYVTMLKSSHNLKFPVLKKKRYKIQIGNNYIRNSFTEINQTLMKTRWGKMMYKPWTSCLVALFWWPQARRCRRAWPETQHQSSHCQWLLSLCKRLPEADHSVKLDQVWPPHSSPCCHLYL